VRRCGAGGLHRGEEGIETIIELRESYPDVKILAMSGGGSIDPAGPLTDARFLGADATLPKPFSIEDLQAEVERLLG
jgi:DNA-binding response OmpR family regulator